MLHPGIKTLSPQIQDRASRRGVKAPLASLPPIGGPRLRCPRLVLVGSPASDPGDGEARSDR
jgi:hypothetical protein